MALWRIADDDDPTVSMSASVGASYTHWTAGLHSSSDVDDDDDVVVGDDELWDLDSEPAMKRLATTTQHRPLHVPSYYRMRPVCVKLCEKAEKVRAFAYNDIRQVMSLIFLSAVIINIFIINIIIVRIKYIMCITSIAIGEPTLGGGDSLHSGVS